MRARVVPISVLFASGFFFVLAFSISPETLSHAQDTTGDRPVPPPRKRTVGTGALQTLRNRQSSASRPAAGAREDTASSANTANKRAASPTSRGPTRSLTPGQSPTGAAPSADRSGESGAEATGETAEETSFFARAIDMVRHYAVWILAVSGAGVLAALGWFLLAGRRDAAADEPADTARHRGGSSRRNKYSSTKISARDVEKRLTGRSLEGTEVETDREYALVVDEAALKDELDSEETADGATAVLERFRAAMESGNYDTAFKWYARLRSAAAKRASGAAVTIDPKLEAELSEHFFRAGDYRHATQVLEHLVASRGEGDIPSEVYFNLAYAHIQRKMFDRSRHYLELFVRSDAKPEHKDRAQKILQRLAKVS